MAVLTDFFVVFFPCPQAKGGIVPRRGH